ncbi:MAG: T9SS C-terminal target domain-containing protein, partial [Bacteroidetes bacterium]
PNPATDQVDVRYTLESDGPAHLRILSPGGEVIRDLNAGTKSAGDHQVTLDISDLKPGVYIVQLMGTFGTQSQKIRVE